MPAAFRLAIVLEDFFFGDGRMSDEERSDRRSLAASWRLPFNRPTGWRRRFSQTGLCVQGNHGAFSHTGELAFAFDWSMPVGTPVVAAREGVVAAAIGGFKENGMRPEHKARGNYVAIRHVDGLYSRYYHLEYNSIMVCVGQAVAEGQVQWSELG